MVNARKLKISGTPRKGEKNVGLFVLGVIGVVAVLGLIMMLSGDKTTGAATGARLVPNQMQVSMYPNIMLYPDDINPQLPLGKAAASPAQQQAQPDLKTAVYKKLGAEQHEEQVPSDLCPICKKGCTVSQLGVLRCI